MCALHVVVDSSYLASSMQVADERAGGKVQTTKLVFSTKSKEEAAKWKQELKKGGSDVPAAEEEEVREPDLR